jgi:hypothetical protein
MPELAVTTDTPGAAHISLVVGEAPEVRDIVALIDLGPAEGVPALDSIVLEFDHYGRVVGLRVTDSVDSVLSPSLLNTRQTNLTSSGITTTGTMSGSNLREPQLPQV